MKRNALIISVIMLVVGIIGRVYADGYSYVDDTGLLHDSAWLPIGTLLIVISVLALLVLGVLYLVSYIKNRKKA